MLHTNLPPRSCGLPAFPPSLLATPSPLSFCLVFPWKNIRQVWQEMRQMAGMTGGTFFFLEGENERECRHTSLAFFFFPPPHFCETLWLLDHQQACENSTVSVHRHTHSHPFHTCTHTLTTYALYNKPVWCFGLGANRHSETVTAYNIRMMEMSLSCGGLWLTCELVANIECLLDMSCSWQYACTVIAPVRTHIHHVRSQICLCAA